MESFFNDNERKKLLERFDKLKADTKAQWGKMNVAQMLHHENDSLRNILGEITIKHQNQLLGSWFFKSLAYKGDMFGKGSPTLKEIKIDITKQYNFEEEKKKAIAYFKQLADEGETAIKNKVHPFFGKLNTEQWGKHISKHLNHHLTQFGL